MNPEGRGCGELRSCHCTPVWVTTAKHHLKKKKKLKCNLPIMHNFSAQLLFKILFIYYYYTLSSEIHVQNVQVCYIGIHLPWWFAAPINLSSTLGISPIAVLPLAPTSCYPSPISQAPDRSQCVMFPFLCPCVLIV